MNIFASILGVVAVGIGGWIASRIRKPSDLDRALLLSAIAQDAAGLVLANNPKLSWVGLLEATIRQIAQVAGLPTKNAAAIQRAAAGALVKVGAVPVDPAALSKAEVKVLDAKSGGK